MNKATIAVVAMANIIDDPSDEPLSLDGSGSSGIACSAENLRAEKPLWRDSSNTSAPRNTGHRRKDRNGSRVTHCCSLTAMVLSGRRTTTTKLFGERIITPSRTAWPPMYGLR